MKNVLLISYYFPPSGGPGVQRMLKFARYLPERGYRPVVLTVPETAEFPVRDPSLLAEIPPECRVVRAPIRELYDLYRKLTGRPRAESIDLHAVSSRRRGLRERLLRTARGALFIPDGRVGWLPGGVREGLRICGELPIHAVVATGPPFTAHWIGRRISERSGLPLVLDYRDPWTRAPFYPSRPGWARRLDERLERSCLLRASRVVTVNRAIRDDLLARHPRLSPETFEILTNGYDPADFSGVDPSPPRAWTLTHTGTLYPSRIPHVLLDVLRGWVREEPELRTALRLRFAGRIAPELQEILARPPFDAIASVEGYVPHRESIRFLVDSHLLLLLIVDDPQSRGMLTGKVFEYIGSGTPILALAPEGEAADLIRETRAGQVVPPGDAGAIARAIREAYAAYREGRRPFGEPDAGAREAYARPALTARLAALLDRLGPPEPPLSPAPPVDLE